MTLAKIALIGFGEVGQILAQDLARAGVRRLVAWDTAFDDAGSRPSRALAHHPVEQADGAAAAVKDAELVISAVTAEQDVEAARAAASGLEADAFFLDLNSCSPGRKRASADLIEQAGGRYVEVAVMSPFPPKRIASPMLLGGPHIHAWLRVGTPLGFTGARAYSPEIGRAAATKLCRSVMIKGLEALLTESMLAARHYGVEEEVLDSLSDLLPLPDWRATAQYMISRSAEHGARRAEEMREAAQTVVEAGCAPTLSRAIAERQDATADVAHAEVLQLLKVLGSPER